MAYQDDRITAIPAPLPKDYDRGFSFTDYQTLNPGDPMPGPKLDTEFANIEQALDETQARLRLIQRDDGAFREDFLVPYIEDNLVSTDTEKALSANQGRVLNNKIGLLEPSTDPEAKNKVTALFDITSLASLDADALLDGQQFRRKEFWPDTGVGGVDLYWKADEPVANHNGGTIIDPAKISELDAGAKTFGTYFDADTVSGNTGCFVADSDLFDCYIFGAVHDASHDSTLPIQAALDSARGAGSAATISDGDFGITHLEMRHVDVHCASSTLWALQDSRCVDLGPGTKIIGLMRVDVTNAPAFTSEAFALDASYWGAQQYGPLDYVEGSIFGNSDDSESGTMLLLSQNGPSERVTWSRLEVASQRFQVGVDIQSSHVDGWINQNRIKGGVNVPNIAIRQQGPGGIIGNSFDIDIQPYAAIPSYGWVVDSGSYNTFSGNVWDTQYFAESIAFGSGAGPHNRAYPGTLGDLGTVVNSSGSDTNVVVRNPVPGYRFDTFEPSISDGTTTVTPTNSYGRYVQSGRVVNLWISLIDIDVSTLDGSEFLRITGIPKSSASTPGGFRYVLSVQFNNLTISGIDVDAAFTSNGSTELILYEQSQSGSSALPVSSVTSGTCDLFISGAYETEDDTF